MAKVVAIASSSKLVADINEQHRLFNSFAEKAIDHAIRCGLLLLQAKDSVKHGEWGNWLKANIKFSERQAQNYMRVASLPNEKRNAVADLSLRKAIDHLAKPTAKPRVTVTRNGMSKEDAEAWEAIPDGSQVTTAVDWGDEEEEDSECDGPADFARRGFLQACRLVYAKDHAQWLLEHPEEISEEITRAAVQAAIQWDEIIARLEHARRRATS
jgi:hypothetical protein